MIRKYRINDIPEECYNKTYDIFEFEMEGAYADKLWLINSDGPIIIEGLSGDGYCYTDRFDNKMKKLLESITVNLQCATYNMQLDIDYAKKRYGAIVKTI